MFAGAQRLILAVAVIASPPTIASAAVEVVPPSRESLEQHGWSIGFAAPDRALAAPVMEHLARFEQQITRIENLEHALGPQEIAARAAELAQGLARLCALPGHEGALQEEIVRFLPALDELRAALPGLFLPRKIELWRAEERDRRLAAGEAVSGFRWNATAGRAERAVHVRWTLHAREHRISWDETPPPAVVLIVSDARDEEPAVAELAANFQTWSDEVGRVVPTLIAEGTRLALWSAVFNVVMAECAHEASARWIAAGLAGWSWPELAGVVLPKSELNRYAPLVVTVPVSARWRPALDLEAWPAAHSADHEAMARLVFANIAEWHGRDAVARVLQAFWALPRDARSSASLKEVYREVVHEPLESRAPWGSLGRSSEGDDAARVESGSRTARLAAVVSP